MPNGIPPEVRAQIQTSLAALLRACAECGADSVREVACDGDYEACFFFGHSGTFRQSPSASRHPKPSEIPILEFLAAVYPGRRTAETIHAYLDREVSPIGFSTVRTRCSEMARDGWLVNTRDHHGYQITTLGRDRLAECCGDGQCDESPSRAKSAEIT